MPLRPRSAGGGSRNEGFDSMRLVSVADDPETASDSGGSGEHGAVATTLNMYGVATMAMVDTMEAGMKAMATTMLEVAMAAHHGWHRRRGGMGDKPDARSDVAPLGNQ